MMQLNLICSECKTRWTMQCTPKPLAVMARLLRDLMCLECYAGSGSITLDSAKEADFEDRWDNE